MKRSIFLSIILFVTTNSQLFAEIEGDFYCFPEGEAIAKATDETHYFTLAGDSRAFLLARYPNMLDAFNNSKEDGSFILSHDDQDKGPIAGITNHAWPGFRADDATVYLNELYNEDTEGSTYWRRVDQCGGVYTKEKIVLNLGGNDMVDLYKHLVKLEGDLELLYTLATGGDVSALVYNLFTENHTEEYAEHYYFWEWAYKAKIENIHSAMEKTVHRLLSANRNGSSDNEIILVDIAPRLYGNDAAHVDMKESFALAVGLSHLNRDYYFKLVPELKGVYGDGRVHFLDIQNEFAENIMGYSGEYIMSYYYGPAYTYNVLANDGIHFTDAGNAQFAKMLAAKMAYIGWYESDLDQDVLAGISEGIPQEIGGGGGDCDLACQIALCYLSGICN